jgi:hypothetical protein
MRSSTYSTFDRSFNIRYQLAFEGKYRPALAIGLRDFVGNSLYAGEYLVATKHVAPTLKFTGGIGWGRFGSYNGFTNPLSRVFGAGWNGRSVGSGLGGSVQIGNWFHSPAAFFGGVEWQTPIRGLSFKAEYSSVAYTLETVTHSFFTRRSPFNFGATYRFKNGNQVSAYYLYGDQLALSGSLVFNPKHPPSKGSVAPAPLPVLARPDDRYDTSWTGQSDAAQILRGNVETLLAADGQALEGMALTGTKVSVWFRNLKHESNP